MATTNYEYILLIYSGVREQNEYQHKNPFRIQIFKNFIATFTRIINCFKVFR